MPRPIISARPARLPRPPPRRILPLALLLLMASPAAPAAAREGVILLHGLCRTARSRTAMQRALEREGYAVVNHGYPSRTADIATLAAAALPAALADPKLAACDKIHCVTHSLGGLLVRQHFSTHRDPRLGRVVMLGPPNQGSEVADRLKTWSVYRRLNGPAGDQLGTDPSSLPNQLGPVNFELGVVAGDRTINGINSLMIPGPDDGKVSVERTKVAGMADHIVLHVTHPYLMKNKTVIAQTLHFLRTGKFENNGSARAD